MFPFDQKRNMFVLMLVVVKDGSKGVNRTTVPLNLKKAYIYSSIIHKYALSVYRLRLP